jgi:hypothetical protein
MNSNSSNSNNSNKLGSGKANNNHSKAGIDSGTGSATKSNPDIAAVESSTRKGNTNGGGGDGGGGGGNKGGSSDSTNENYLVGPPVLRRSRPSLGRSQSATTLRLKVEAPERSAFAGAGACWESPANLVGGGEGNGRE